MQEPRKKGSGNLGIEGAGTVGQRKWEPGSRECRNLVKEEVGTWE